MKSIALILGALLLRFLIISPFAILFWWLRRSARRLHPRENGTSVEFSLAPQMLVLIEIVIVSLVALTALSVLETIRKGEGLYAALIPLSVLAAILASGAAEFHHRALSEPDVSLSAHPAPSIRLLA
jgi:uncharacterized Tic20 family protein